MKRKRRQHSAEFKARVVLEALRGIKTINQIAEENEVHPVQISHGLAGRVEWGSTWLHTYFPL